MSETTDALRAHLRRALDWHEAHVGFDKAIDGIPPAMRGAHAAGFEHSPWQLLEHLRIAQEDILDFCLNKDYRHERTWPDDYWPRQSAPADESAWAESIASFKRSRTALQDVASDVADLMAPVPTGKSTQTCLRALLLIVDHNAYHVGQLVAVRRALAIWG